MLTVSDYIASFFIDKIEVIRKDITAAPLASPPFIVLQSPRFYN